MYTRNIEIDFGTAKRQAAELREAADQLEKLATRDLQDVLEGIRQSWQGESARAYAAKAEQAKAELLRTAKDLRWAAEKIRSKAEQIYRAEMEAARIARQREQAYSGGGFGF